MHETERNHSRFTSPKQFHVDKAPLAPKEKSSPHGERKWEAANDIYSQLHDLVNASPEATVTALRTDADLMGYMAPQLTELERAFLWAVEQGDTATAKHMLDRPNEFHINKNCRDPLGRSALVIAIENEHNELLRVLLIYNLDLGDSLLYAINAGNLESVEMLLQAQQEMGQKKNLTGILGVAPSSSFTSDITPIILAAHKDNYEILKLLLSRGDSISIPHDVRCSCVECVCAQKENSLRHSRARINSYKALASSSYIALTSKDPILTAFELSMVLKRLQRVENEFKNEYSELAVLCQQFAVNLLEQTRHSQELAIILNHDSGQTMKIVNPISFMKLHDEQEPMTLSRMKLAIQYKQKDFVAHPHCQQLLSTLWYDGLPGFRKKNAVFQFLMVVAVAFLFPLLSIIYLLFPRTTFGAFVKRPFIKFLLHCGSYLGFLGLLALAGLRVEYAFSYEDFSRRLEERGPSPSITECFIMVYVLGYLWHEIKELCGDGPQEYVKNMWNLIDLGCVILFVITFILRLVAFIWVINGTYKSPLMDRGHWDFLEPVLISECLFSAATILSFLKLVHFFTVSPQLGPLQISLGRMLNDIFKFFCIIMLVLVAFALGLNQIFWFYAKVRGDRCQNFTFAYTGERSDLYQYCITHGRYFTSIFEIVQSLFWAAYGLVDLQNLNLEFSHPFTEFVGKMTFGTYSVIALIVLLNMLIAMMNNSYQNIAMRSDTEWKFARTRLWISYFDEGSTLPPPFNIVPSIKSMQYLVKRIQGYLCICDEEQRKALWRSMKKVVRKVNEKEERYQKVMAELVQRYLSYRQRIGENQSVTEDDLNEIKGDISSFRYELLDILSTNGMQTPAYTHSTKKLRRRASKRGAFRYGQDRFQVCPPSATGTANYNAGLPSHSVLGSFVHNEILPSRPTSPSVNNLKCTNRNTNVSSCGAESQPIGNQIVPTTNEITASSPTTPQRAAISSNQSLTEDKPVAYQSGRAYHLWRQLSTYVNKLHWEDNLNKPGVDGSDPHTPRKSGLALARAERHNVSRKNFGSSSFKSSINSEHENFNLDVLNEVGDEDSMEEMDGDQVNSSDPPQVTINSPERFAYDGPYEAVKLQDEIMEIPQVRARSPIRVPEIASPNQIRKERKKKSDMV